MSLSLQDIKGPIVVTAKVQAKPGKADELAQWFANLKARVDSDLEPLPTECSISATPLPYLKSEYADYEAVRKHTKENPLFQEYLKVREEIVPDPPHFWPARSLPELKILPQN